MKAWLRGFYYSFPIQLLFLHIRKYQVLLLFWLVLFSTVNGGFMKTFGADSLFLAPEYIGSVSSFSFAIVGLAVGMFIMSWNITSFILFSKYFRFLAATTNPFLKYCTNNAIIPIVFLAFYFYKAYDFIHYKELIGINEIWVLFGGFFAGLIFILAISLLYFFKADRSILRKMLPVISSPSSYILHLGKIREIYVGEQVMKVEWYFDHPFKLRKARDVSHYTNDFVESIFKRHHLAAILSVFAAFVFLVGIGFLLDYAFFQLPAAASILIFFSILIGVSGAITYFLQSWSIPYLVGLIILLNVFYQWGWIDPRNKAYGMDYWTDNRPSYSKEGLLALCTPEAIESDRKNMIGILEAWKKNQDSERPLMVIINTSGGGHRSATFTMRVLQHLDSLTQGSIMKKTVLINGASGGMIGAAYFRELYLRKIKGDDIQLQDREYVDDIAEDLLNPLFTSFFTRDIISPAQKFRIGEYSYVKDRGYAFELKLKKNTRGYLDKHLKDYAEDERAANIPMMFFNSVVTRDSRKVIISTQPVRFMMQGHRDSALYGVTDPDAIDFASFFKDQNPLNLRMLSALRMNATFPVILPNVWLPSDPVIDVMDAGLRDNYGQESSIRFISSFQDWIRENTSGVLLLQIRDRGVGGWESPFVSDDITDHITKPFLLLQYNWFKMMEYFQNDMLDYYTLGGDNKVFKVVFQYATTKEENKAALNFHLTRREERDIINAIYSPANQIHFQRVMSLINKQDANANEEKAAAGGNNYGKQ